MRRVTLHRLTLENFMGVASFELDLGGADAVVRATNGAGKTTLATAFSWLLTGKDTHGQADFQVKTTDSAGQELHNLEHSVEAVLDVDGELVSLKRAFREVWTKKRGSAREEFTGHESLFWVDGVPCGTKKEFDEKVAELLPTSAWRELTNPDAWHAQHWQKRRQDLIDICGDVSDDDVLAENPDLADLPDVLGRHTPDEHRKVIEARRREINNELKLLPARVDEVKRGVADLEEVDATPEQIESILKSTREQRTAVANDIAAAKSGGSDAAAERKRLREVEDELSKLERDAQRAADDAALVQRRELLNAQQAVSEVESDIQRAQRAVEEAQERLGAANATLQTLRAEYQALSARRVEAHTDDSCAACGQALPADQVEAAHAKAVAELNARKAAELERNVASGKRVKAAAEKAAEDLAAAEHRRDDATERLERAQQAAGKINDAPPKKLGDVTKTKAYTALARERDDLTRQIEQLTAGDDTAVGGLQEELERLDALIVGFQADQARLQQLAAAEKRTAELLGRETILAQEFEELERELHLIESFIRAKSAMLTDRINSRFSSTTFRLFEEQINGGLADACVALVGGVPYGAGLNRAARINSGLDVIRVLQEHHDVAVPVLVDEAESVVELLDMPTQLVALIVDERHPHLHVVLSEERELISA